MSTDSVQDLAAVSALKQDTERLEYRKGVAGKIENPLTGIPRHQLLNDVERFAREKGLDEHLPILQKGALLAQNPMDYDNLDVLTQEEKSIIDYEHKHKWHQTKTLYFAIILCSVGACVQGWDQTGSNGANLSFPMLFGIASPKGSPNHMHDEWIVGLINSAPYIAASMLGCWLSYPLNNKFGRRGTIFFAATILMLSPIGSACTQSWPQLFICRLILGVGMGAKGSTVPVFSSELAPAAIRGALVMSWQLFVTLGIFLGFSANAVVAKTGAIAWRLQLGSAFIPALPLSLFVFFCPESPRWLIKKERYVDAFKSLKRLRHHEVQAARDLYMIYVQVGRDLSIIQGGSYITRFIQLFTVPRVRRATMAAWVVMIGKHTMILEPKGINIIAFYSSSVFVNAGYSNLQALYASIGFGAINFVCAWPAVFTIDTFGRRSLLLMTFPNMAWTLLGAGFSFFIEGDKKKLGAIACFIYLFAAVYSVGEGPVPFTYAAEVFPIANREQGMAFSVATNMFFASVLGMSWPAMLAALGPQGAFGFYAGMNVLAFIMIFFLLPETKQRTLEELDQVFTIPTSRFASYQTNKWLPWFIMRYIFQDKQAVLEPLFEVDDEAGKGKPRAKKHSHYKA
ncbi:hypothetical protein T439DRAFT_303148 [Meredithblackwellia eburnea MCA 4105]